MSPGQAALVALAGGAGALVRAVVDRRVRTQRFPYGMLLVNVSGAFMLGLLVGQHPGAPALRILGTGLLGGFTTFSTWVLDTVQLPRRRAVANVAASLVLGVLAVLVGRALG